MEIMTIGIAGGTGSGKTTLTRRLQQEFGEDVSVLYHDNYYKAHYDLCYEERSKLNYDHPDSFDTPLMIEHLIKLRRGEPICCPVYDYAIHNRSDKVIKINPTKVILVEGILILADPVLKD